MSDEKKPIPILNDVIRTGNTDKAVKSGINPYPRKLAPRKQQVKIPEDAKPSADPLTEQYAKTIKQKASTPTQQADKPKAVATPPVLTDAIEKKPATARKRQATKGTDAIKAPAQTARTPDKGNTTEAVDLEPMIETIIQEMIPDLEQHLRMQLRFELKKHLPTPLFTSKNKDNDQ